MWNRFLGAEFGNRIGQACGLYLKKCLTSARASTRRFALVTFVMDQHGSLRSLEVSCSVFSQMRSEGFPFIVWGSGGWTLVRLQLVVASFSLFFASFLRRFRVVNSVSMGKAAKPRSF